MEAAEDIVIPMFTPGCKPTLIPTGLKAYCMEDECYLLLNRSSGPKKGFILANSVGLIDSDYYGNPDNDFAPWRNDNAFASDARTHQGMVYAIQHPFTGELIYPYNNGHWRYSQEEMLHHMNGWCEYELRELYDAKRRAEICGIEEGKVRVGVKG